MSERVRNPERARLADPIENSALLNAVAAEISADEIASMETRRAIDDMLWLAAGKSSEGGAQMVGLAAPQIGVSKRIAIIDMNATGMREQQNMQVFINPVITEMADDMVDGREGCWSCGDYCANVPRASWVVVTALDREGNPVTMRLEGFTARVAQHEIDHLNGIRCIDRVPKNEPWRLHRVDVNNKDEFNRYRTEWPHWSKTFPRSEWEQFHDGIRPEIKITGTQHDGYIEYRAEQNGVNVGTVKLACAATHEPALAAEYPDTPVVYQLYVDEQARGQGVAGKLMDAVERVAIMRGDRALLLGVVPDNTVARRLYERRGYKHVALDGGETVESFWETQQGGITRQESVRVMPMTKDLSDAGGGDAGVAVHKL